MGYGSGNGTRHADNAAHDAEGARVAAYFDNGMTAHVWAAHGQSFGRSHNGNFYFECRTLYSYGSHFVVGYLVPKLDNPAEIATALICSDSYSVSTTRHVSEAQSAARHLKPIMVPNLCKIAQIFDAGFSIAAERVKAPWQGGNDYHDGAGRPRKINRGAMAKYMAPRLKAHFSDPENVPGSDKWRAAPKESRVAQIFALAGCDNPERRARAALKEAERKARAAADKKARADRAERLDYAARAARTKPADILARMESDARAAAGRYSGSADRAREEWERKGRDIFRATKEAKAAGRTAQAKGARRAYDTIRGGLDMFAAFDMRAMRRERIHSLSKTVRAGFAVLAGEAIQTRGGQYRPGEAGESYALQQAAQAAGVLIDALGFGEGGEGAWAARAARVAGISSETGERLQRARAAFLAGKEAADKETRRAALRGDLRALKAVRDIDPAAPVDVKAGAYKTAAGILEKYRTRREWAGKGDTLAKPYREIPREFRLAGFTPDRAADAHYTVSGLAEIAGKALARMVAERESEARGRALELWRAGESIPRELAKFTPRAMPNGGAYVRAKDVTRNAAGEITGGTVETSQGASVPLVHAIKAFRFVALCRAHGRAWERNGHVLRVGHFQVDSIDAKGNFRAGCHSFQWAEIANLAAALGLDGIAPADTTESRESSNA